MRRSIRKRKSRKPKIEIDRPLVFFAQFPLFHSAEFRLGRSPAAASRGLNYHLRAGNLARVHGSTYMVQPRPATIDALVIGSRLVTDAVIAYQAALAFHGQAELPKTISILSRHRLRDCTYDGYNYRTVRPVAALRATSWPFYGSGIEMRYRGRTEVAVCSIERALVDCLDRLDLSPGLEEIWNVFCGQRRLDGDAMVEHALALDNSVTSARVVYFLDHAPDYRLGGAVGLSELRNKMPKTAAFMDPASRRRRDASYVPRWKLMVPAGFERKVESHK